MARGSNNPGLHFSRERRPKLRSTERVETPWMYASWITAVRAFSAVRRGSSEVRLIGSNELPEAFATAWQELVGDCRKDLATQGLDPTWFGTNVTVEDVERVRTALGTARWSVYGRSYGTTIAMTLTARHPDTLRAVVLDSVYPPNPLLRTRGQTFEAALEHLFAACHTSNAAPIPPPLPRDASAPRLLLAGSLDPVTPPDFATLAATAMGSKAVLIVFPTRPQDIKEFTPCGAGLITRFIRAPDAALDTSCAARVPPVPLR